MSVNYTALNDAELVERTKAGDNRGFDELVRRYRDRVYRLSSKILRHEDDAAEALQDAFLSAYRGLAKFKSESTFSTWLYRIATNASLMKLRRRRDSHVSYEQSQGGDADAEPLAIPDASTQPLEELLDSEAREVLGREVDLLPANEKDADAGLIEGWIHDFHAEASPAPRGAPDEVRRLIDLKLKATDPDRAGFWLWEDDGEPRSLSGYGGVTPSGIRIGPVYTPLEHRARGYATNLVAEQSAWLLSRRRFCFLYTDLSNSTSNAIYQRIGYRKVCEGAEIGFEPAA